MVQYKQNSQTSAQSDTNATGLINEACKYKILFHIHHTLTICLIVRNDLSFCLTKTEHVQQDMDLGGPEKFYVQQELNYKQLSKWWGNGKYAHKIKFYLKKI